MKLLRRELVLVRAMKIETYELMRFVQHYHFPPTLMEKRFRDYCEQQLREAVGLLREDSTMLAETLVRFSKFWMAPMRYPGFV